MSKSIMIIGAGPGIGQAVAQRFGKAGWSIVLTGRNVERVEGLVASLAAQGIKAHAVPADAADPAALRAAIAQAESLTGGLSAIHYNAANIRQQDLFSMTDAEIEQDLAVNLVGGLHTIRAAEALFGERGGTILITGGGLGVAPHPGYASLGLGKAALRNIVQGLAKPLGERGIRIALATVASSITAGSVEASDVADIFWDFATGERTGWEAAYPPVAAG
ncbi:MAG: SDR family NAD(P)-dependent oxidoreductase [Sphingobium sp.]